MRAARSSNLTRKSPAAAMVHTECRAAGVQPGTTAPGAPASTGTQSHWQVPQQALSSPTRVVKCQTASGGNASQLPPCVAHCRCRRDNLCTGAPAGPPIDEHTNLTSPLDRCQSFPAAVITSRKRKVTGAGSRHFAWRRVRNFVLSCRSSQHKPNKKQF